MTPEILQIINDKNWPSPTSVWVYLSWQASSHGTYPTIHSPQPGMGRQYTYWQLIIVIFVSPFLMLFFTSAGFGKKHLQVFLILKYTVQYIYVKIYIYLYIYQFKTTNINKVRPHLTKIPQDHFCGNFVYVNNFCHIFCRKVSK